MRSPDAELEKIVGSKAKKKPGALELHVKTSKKIDLDQLQPRFLERGVFVVAIETNSTTDRPTRLLALPTTDPFDALGYMGTNGANYRVDTEAIVEALKSMGRLRLTAVSFDSVEGRLLAAVKAPKKLAQKLFALCPDIADHDEKALDQVVTELRKNRTFKLWWD